MFVNNNCFSDALYWYQKKISSIDQQQWEKSVQERVLNGIHLNVTKKVTKLKTELIDLDLIRGSTFSKAKPKQSWFITTFNGIIKIVLLPFYLRWWIEQTSKLICFILFSLYIFQLSAMFIYFNYDHFNEKNFSTIPLSEVITPIFMFFFLGTIHSQISASSNNHLSRNKSYLKSKSIKVTNLIEKPNKISKKKTENYELNSHLNYDKLNAKLKKNKINNLKLNINTKNNISKLNLKNNAYNRTRPTTSRTSFTGNNDLYCKNINFNSNLKLNSILKKRFNKTDRTKQNNHENDLSDDLTELILSINCSPYSSINSNSNLKFILKDKSSLKENDDIELNSNQKQDIYLNNENNIKSNNENSKINNLNNNNVLKQHFQEHIYQPCKSKYYYYNELNSNKKILDKNKTSEENSVFSSNDSEGGSISPTTPMKCLNDWPMINSDNSSEDEEEEEEEEQEQEQEEEEEEEEEEECDEEEDYGNNEDNESYKELNENILEKKIDNKEINIISQQKEFNINLKSKNCISNKEKHREKLLKPKLTKNIYNLSRKEKKINLFSNSKNDNSDKASCTIYQQNEWRKLDLSILDISSVLIRKVDLVKHNNEYFYLAIFFSLLFAFIPQIFRLNHTRNIQNDSLRLPSFFDETKNSLLFVNLNQNFKQSSQQFSQQSKCTYNAQIFSLFSQIKNNHSNKSKLYQEEDNILNKINYNQQDNSLKYESIFTNNSTEEIIFFFNYLPVLIFDVLSDMFKNNLYSWQIRFVIIVSFIQRFTLSLLFFFLLCVAERTFRERFLYAKYFCHLTSARRAKRNELPHFRLNKVRNIKSWLSIRSYLKKHGPQRSVDCIVSTSFILAVVLLTFLCIQLLRESEVCAGNLYCYEMVFWDLAIGIFIMRLIILGSKINRKYRSNLSVLITEQINLYLQLEQKPHKKDELTLANNVLKLAADLLKQLEIPFKISGFSANPYFYNITKVIVLSAFSAVLSEVLGFKLKLYKIKLN